MVFCISYYRPDHQTITMCTHVTNLHHSECICSILILILKNKVLVVSVKARRFQNKNYYEICVDFKLFQAALKYR